MLSARERWYGLPVIWLGAAIFLASIAGCIGLIVAASRHPDESVRLAGAELLHVPLAHEPQRSP